MTKWIRRGFLIPVFFYKYFISPLLPPACRFIPSCSSYAVEAVMVHGIVRGSWLSFCRLARCHPFHAGGLDLVPPPTTRQSTPSKKSGGDHSVLKNSEKYAATSGVQGKTSW